MCLGLARQIDAPLSGNIINVFVNVLEPPVQVGVNDAGISSMSSLVVVVYSSVSALYCTCAMRCTLLILADADDLQTDEKRLSLLQLVHDLPHAGHCATRSLMVMWAVLPQPKHVNGLLLLVLLPR